MILFLAGDVMTGRGIDQVLSASVDPRLHEPHVRSARRYVELAEGKNGEIPAPVPYDYVWGDALAELEARKPDARIVNLETAVTTSDAWWSTKGIHYRMHPSNIHVLSVAGIDLCVLANNHVLDWGRDGLRETLLTLERAGIAAAGAGAGNSVGLRGSVPVQGGRVVVYAWASVGAGVPTSWAPGPGTPGVQLLPSVDAAGLRRVMDPIETDRRPGDIVIVSLHWGGNWGYDVPRKHRHFAHALVESGVDLVFGHSSHHPKGVEVYRDRLILYGAGDFLNDYEGIGGRTEFRGDLVLGYFPQLDASGALVRLVMTPFRIRRFRLARASPPEAAWLARTVDRESRKLGTTVSLDAEGRLRVE